MFLIWVIAPITISFNSIFNIPFVSYYRVPFSSLISIGQRQSLLYKSSLVCSGRCICLCFFFFFFTGDAADLCRTGNYKHPNIFVATSNFPIVKQTRKSFQIIKPVQTHSYYPVESECSSTLGVRFTLFQNFSVSCIYPVSFNCGSHSASCASAMSIYGPKVVFKSSFWVPGK